MGWVYDSIKLTITQTVQADLGLPASQLTDIMQMGNFGDELNFDFFTGVACLTLSGSVRERVSALLVV